MKVAIIGGGASGVLCALRLKVNNSDIDVTIFERNSKPLKKVGVTGNGRCNFLNDDFSKEHFHSILENNIGSIITKTNKDRVLDFIKSLGFEIDEFVKFKNRPFSGRFEVKF